MGSSESTLSATHDVEDGITTVSKRSETVDHVLHKLQSLAIANPIFISDPTESSLTDILVRKHSNSSGAGVVDPKVLLELFSMYQEWQEQQTHNINTQQEELENKIEAANNLAIKLLQTYNLSVSSMKKTSSHLSGVHQLQVEVGELKGMLNEVISDCSGLCKKIAAEGPESLHSVVNPFTAAFATSSLSSTSKDLSLS